MIKQGGDDLEDDFVVDDLVALSGDETAVVEGGFFSEGDDNADATGGAITSDDQSRKSWDKAAEKKRKRREKEKERKAKRRKLAENIEVVKHSIAGQLPEEISCYLASMQVKTFSDMSAMELDDMRISETSILDTTAWTNSRTLDHLVEFIIKIIPPLHARLMQRSKHNGAPTMLFLTGAALRVADVTRTLKDKRLRGEKGAEVAKLFAKHFKLSEHVSYLKRTKIGAAVGTPGRIGKLLCETDALSVSALSHIILDVSFKDAKRRSLLDIQETRDEVFKTVLGSSKVQQAMKDGKIRLVLF